MTIRFQCPSGHRLSVSDDMAGRTIRCARCKKTAEVPKETAPKPPPLPRKKPSAEPEEESEPKPKGPSLWSRWSTRAENGPVETYAADQGTIRSVRWLGLFLAIVIVFSLLPVAWKMHWNLATAPGWARLVVLLALVQAAYVAWMSNRPDFTTVWVVMLVFAAVATLYGSATAMAIATPRDQPMLLGMAEVRYTAGTWCCCVLLAMSLATYLCGRTATKWRRTCQLKHARGQQ